VRLWSLHPKYLDARGLVAVWREGLLALAVLEERTRGYRRHPQLDRFRSAHDPAGLVELYLLHVFEEGQARGYAFNREKIGNPSRRRSLPVTTGQLDFELLHLKRKLRVRSPTAYARIRGLSRAEPHPMFRPVPGSVEPWERAQAR
jgi:hypothetical protein